jgi:hypothetical protein
MVSICWRSCCCSSSSSASRRQSSRWWHSFARVCRSVELFCLLPKEHTHTPQACRKSGDQDAAYACAVVEKLPLQRLMSSLCMSAAATDLSSICLFCPAVCLNTQHGCPSNDCLSLRTLQGTALLIHHTTVPSHTIHYYHYNIPSRLPAYLPLPLPIAEP